MNQQFFNIKRAHYSVLRQMRRPLAQFGLTPARFDLMHAQLCAQMGFAWR